MRTDVTGRVGVDDVLAGEEPCPRPWPFRDLGDVVADRLAQAGGMDGDHLRVVNREDVRDGLEQVRLSAENARSFGERTVPRHYRLLVVPRERAAMWAQHPCAAVAVRQAGNDAQSRVHGPDGLAGLGRVTVNALTFDDLGICVWSNMQKAPFLALSGEVTAWRRCPRLAGWTARAPGSSSRCGR